MQLVAKDARHAPQDSSAPVSVCPHTAGARSAVQACQSVAALLTGTMDTQGIICSWAAAGCLLTPHLCRLWRQAGSVCAGHVPGLLQGLPGH